MLGALRAMVRAGRVAGALVLIEVVWTLWRVLSVEELPMRELRGAEGDSRSWSWAWHHPSRVTARGTDTPQSSVQRLM
jgi:hypothetical protein